MYVKKENKGKQGLQETLVDCENYQSSVFARCASAEGEGEVEDVGSTRRRLKNQRKRGQKMGRQAGYLYLARIWLRWDTGAVSFLPQ